MPLWNRPRRIGMEAVLALSSPAVTVFQLHFLCSAQTQLWPDSFKHTHTHKQVGRHALLQVWSCAFVSRVSFPLSFSLSHPHTCRLTLSSSFHSPPLCLSNFLTLIKAYPQKLSNTKHTAYPHTHTHTLIVHTHTSTFTHAHLSLRLFAYHRGKHC